MMGEDRLVKKHLTKLSKGDRLLLNAHGGEGLLASLFLSLFQLTGKLRVSVHPLTYRIWFFTRCDHCRLDRNPLAYPIQNICLGLSDPLGEVVFPTLFESLVRWCSHVHLLCGRVPPPYRCIFVQYTVTE